MADPGERAPRHHQRLHLLSTDEAVVEEWIRADGRSWQGRLLTLDRRGVLLRATKLPPAEAPERLSRALPVAAPLGTIPVFPVAMGRHELRKSRVGSNLRITFAVRGESHETVLASLVGGSELLLLDLRLGSGRSPGLAALTWRAAAGDALVEGVEILDLRRARASLWLHRGLEHHQAGRHREAREYFRHARDLDPEFPEAVYDLACTEALLGETEAAMLLLARALELSPDRLRMVAEEDEDLSSLQEHPEWLPLLRGDR